MRMQSEKSVSSEATGLKLLFRALKYRNYRLFFGGQTVSLIGTWMQRIAMGWLVYRMTNSPFLLGVVGFAGQIPGFLVGPFAGVIADRVNRHKMLVIAQIMAMVQASILAALVLTNLIEVWHLVVLAVMLGIIMGFDIPARQSFLVQMVENKEDLGNAIALNSSMFNMARLIGPSVAGILIAAMGEGICFLVNALTFLPVIGALLAMRVKPIEMESKNKEIWKGLREGLNYAFGFAPIKSIILLFALISLVGFPYQVLMPIFAKDVLGGGPDTLGFLMGGTGVGAMVGAVFLASRKSVVGLERVIAIAAGSFGLGLVVFSLSHWLWFSLMIVLVIGFGMMVQLASSTTVLQTIVDDDKRGRVMSFHATAFMGMAPVGSLLFGSLASKIGAPYTLLIGGAVCVLGSLLFARELPVLRKAVRPIYVKMGIIPEVATGIRTATVLTTPPRD
jgi:MFS family permease